jgi:ParB family chromosome partitioning protein
VQRAPLHPLDQFRAFLALREKGLGEEAIAASFFVSAQIVRQRLKLASVSPRLLEVYAEDGMTLDQLTAFTVNGDHARQEQVWETVQRAHIREPHQIRRLLTEGAVRAADKRSQFVGMTGYEEAGGIVLRDLFQPDDGGWLQDPALLDRLLAEKLEREAEVIRAEGWRWIEVAVDFPYGHTYGLRHLAGAQRPLSAEEAAVQEALQAESSSWSRPGPRRRRCPRRLTNGCAKAAPFKRNDEMLKTLPIGVIVCPGTGIQDNLADKARRLGVPVWRFGDGGA